MEAGQYLDCAGTAVDFDAVFDHDVSAGCTLFPHDIIEASRLEGLSEIKIFFTMFLPIMKSTYGAAMTVTFMNAWNNYLWPTIILQDKNQVTMPMLVANLKSGYSVDYGMLMLGVLICTLPTAVIFLCLQKSFANGIAGAVK